MWPMLLDYTRDECKRILRKLELEAYASVVSAFRAQGDLSKEKKKMLQDLSVALSISLERHRAEVRRAVNDEHLNTIADRLAGPNTSTEWAIEGRRLVPLMPRLVPQTAFTAIANSAANAQAAKNAAMPVPSATGLKETFSMPSTPVNGTIAVTQPNCPPTPTQNVRGTQQQNTSGKSISSVSNSSIIVLNDGDNEDTENNLRKRKRSSSLDSGGGTPQKLMMPESTSPDAHMLCGTSSMASATECLPVSSITQVTTSTISQPVVTRTVTLPVGPNPLRITLTTVAHRTTNTVSTASTPKQVILVSTSGAPTPSILQRSLNVPVVKTVSTATTLVTTHQGKPCVSTPGITVSSNVLQQNATSTSISLNSELTPTTSSLLSSVPPVLSTSGGFTQTISTSTAPMSSTLLSRARPKTPSVPRHQMRPRSSSGNTVTTQPQIMNQQGPSPQLPSPNTLQPAQRAHSPISRTRSPASRTPSPASATHMPRSQSPASGQSLPHAQSPVTTMPRAPSPATNTPRAQSPVAATRSQSPVSMQIPPKTAVSPKGASKSSVHRPPAVSGSRTLLTSSTKTSVKTLSPAISSMQCPTRTPIQSSLRPSVPTQQSIQASGRAPCPQQQTQKTGQGQVQLKSTAPSPRTVQYRNEGGLKIITQNVSSSRILPKPPVSTVQNFTGASNRINTIASSTSGVTGNARIVNFQQQMGARMARAISPSAITALGLQSGMPATALRVTLPAGTLGTPAVVRATAPGAKPNVIVVHKAQVWPQSQGATIVVSSSGPMSRIPAEAVQEAVSFIQRQERNRQSGTLTLVKSVTVTQPSATLVSASTTSTISSASTAGSTNAINQLDTFQPDCTQESDCSNIHLPEKTSDSDRKNTLLADIIQAAGILPDNSSMPLIDDTQTGELITAREDSVTAQVPSAVGESCQAEMHNSGDLTRSLIVEGDLYESSSKTPDAVSVTKDKSLIENENDSSSIMEVKEWTPQSFNPSPPIKKKNEKDAIPPVNVVEESTPSISIQDINLDQLQEGQILELQAQDAAELLSQHGQLSKEVLELLQQAGLQVQQVEVQDCDTATTKIPSPETSENNEESQSHCDEATELKGKLETELDPQTGILYVTEDLKPDIVASETASEFKNEASSSLKPEDRSVVDIFSTALASAQLDLHALQFVDDVIGVANNMSQTSKNVSNLNEVSNASNISQHGSTAESDSTNSPLSTVKEPTVTGADVASPLLSSTSQPHSDEDILLVPIDIDDPNMQSSGELHSQSSKRDQTRSVVVETMPDMSALTLPPGALVVSNITVELGGLDTSTMKLEDFTSQQVDCNIKDSSDETLEESNSSGQVQQYDSKVGSSSTETREFVSAQQKKCRFLPEEQYISPHLSGWSRMASGLLDRAIKHKKSLRPNTSHWTLNQDVSTSALHENLKIMDFSTIRSKLENRTYLNFREFHADMMLVKDICQKYSAFGHNYSDCADMFAFYLQEYNRLADKWQKSHLLSSSKRIKTS